MTDLSNFFVKMIVLNKVSTCDNTLSLQYLLDDEPVNLSFSYNSISFNDPKLNTHPEVIQTFAVSLGIVCFLRFAVVLPEYFNVSKYSKWISPAVLKFVQNALPQWAEHRYQFERLDYQGPKILLGDETLGSLAALPIWQCETKQSVKALVASGSGKDSLLCAKLIEKAEVDYDLVTYIHNLYGETKAQDFIFDRLSKHLKFQKQHVISIDDGYYPWLENRLKTHKVIEYLQQQDMTKPFRIEAGEVLYTPLVFAPIQVQHDLELAIVGHEKSAEAENLIINETGEKIAHQWGKSIECENEVHHFLNNLFRNIACISITKPIYDVSIFKLLFQITENLPYLTNSCNFKKPWCCECEKCAYVFAGFIAFGDYKKTIAAFGGDLFQNPVLLPIWRELPGLKGYIAWECVGLPEELQLYLYKAYQADVTGVAIDLFCDEILNTLNEKSEDYFKRIESRYSQVDHENHHIPDWLWQKVGSVIEHKENNAI